MSYQLPMNIYRTKAGRYSAQKTFRGEKFHLGVYDLVRQAQAALDAFNASCELEPRNVTQNRMADDDQVKGVIEKLRGIIIKTEAIWMCGGCGYTSGDRYEPCPKCNSYVIEPIMLPNDAKLTDAAIDENAIFTEAK